MVTVWLYVFPGGACPGLVSLFWPGAGQTAGEEQSLWGSPRARQLFVGRSEGYARDYGSARESNTARTGLCPRATEPAATPFTSLARRCAVSTANTRMPRPHFSPPDPQFQAPCQVLQRRWSSRARTSVLGRDPFSPKASVSSLSISNSSLCLCHWVSQAPLCASISSALLGGSVLLLIDPWKCGADQ